MADGIELPEVTVSPGTGDGGAGSVTSGEVQLPPRRTQQPYPFHAVVVIDGQEYWEWESIHVRLSIRDNPPRVARFTCSEQEPMGQSWAAMRIRPGDRCEIFLEGYLVITGQVCTRQVYFDANQHSVEITIVGMTEVLGHGSVISQTGEWRNTTLVGLVQSVVKPYGLSVHTMGDISSEKFPRVASMPGEKPRELIDKHANARQAEVGETQNGAVLLVGTMGGGGMATLIQGRNILIGRETIHNQNIAAGQNFPSPNGGGGEQAYTTTGQRPGTDDDWGANPTHQTYDQQKGGAKFSSGFRPSMVISEIPAWGKGLLKYRTGIENNVDDENQIFVTITVLGWQVPGLPPEEGGLWEPGDLVDVESDWLIMHRPLKLKAVTFSQDNETGTRSTLELVNTAADSSGQFPSPS